MKMEKSWAVRGGLSTCRFSLPSLIIVDDLSYGMVLAKDKSEEEAMRWLIRSVHLYPMNWGCWLEMTSLIDRVEDVSIIFPFQHRELM